MIKDYYKDICKGTPTFKLLMLTLDIESSEAEDVVSVNRNWIPVQLELIRNFLQKLVSLLKWWLRNWQQLDHLQLKSINRVFNCNFHFIKYHSK